VQGQICDILRPQLAMNRFLLLWPHRFPHFGYIHLGGGGSDIRSMSSIRTICKFRCPPLFHHAVIGLSGGRDQGGLDKHAAGLDLTVNQGRKQEQKDIAFRLKSICEAIRRPFSGAVPAVSDQTSK
jgi:hypothetical protein